MILIDITDFISFFLFGFVLYFLSSISKRLGEVMGLRKYYFFYYAGIFFTFTASLIMAFSLGDRESTFIYGYSSFAIGMTLGLITSIKYWGWLVKELIEG